MSRTRGTHGLHGEAKGEGMPTIRYAAGRTACTAEPDGDVVSVRLSTMKTGPRGSVNAMDDSVKVDERRLPLHRRSQPGVVSVVGIGAAIAVAEESAVNKPVVSRTILVLDPRGGVDHQRHLDRRDRQSPFTQSMRRDAHESQHREPRRRHP